MNESEGEIEVRHVIFYLEKILSQKKTLDSDIKNHYLDRELQSTFVLMTHMEENKGCTTLINSMDSGPEGR